MPGKSDSKRTIVDAIRARRVLLVGYYRPRGYRRVEPHACGVSKRGNDVVRVYQVSGPSRSGERVDFWKMMRLDRIHDIQVLDETLAEARAGYERGDADMKWIYEEL